MHHDPSKEFLSNLKYLQKCDLRRYSIPWPSGDRQRCNHHHECNGSSLRRRSNRCHVHRQSFYDVHQLRHHWIRSGISACLQLLLWCEDVWPRQRSLLVLYQSQHSNPAGFLRYWFCFLRIHHRTVPKRRS